MEVSRSTQRLTGPRMGGESLKPLLSTMGLPQLQGFRSAPHSALEGLRRAGPRLSLGQHI